MMMMAGTQWVTRRVSQEGNHERGQPAADMPEDGASPGGLSWRGFGWKTGFPYACIISHVLASADLPAAPPAANCKGY